MLKNIKTYYLFAFVSTVLLSACYKDIGNYSYQTINTITLKLDSSYIGTYGKRFIIKPIISLSQDNVQNTYDTSKYSYEWSTLNSTALYGDQRAILATTRDLDTVLTIAPASTYTLYYRLTDKKTGVQWQTSAKLTVSTSIYEGWLALCDVNGKSRLDMASYALGSYTMLPGVLDSVGSTLSMAGKPMDVTFCSQGAFLSSTLANAIYVTTTEGTNRIDPESFKWNSAMNIQSDMMANVPSNFTVNSIVPSTGQVNYMAGGGNLYYYFRIYSLYWGTTINVVSGETTPFKASPFIAVYPGGYNGAVFYDMDNKRFVRNVYGATSCSVMPSNTPLFSYTTGMDLVYMEYTAYNGGEVFSVLHDNATGKYYLARFTFSSAINQTYYAEITGTDFNKAEHFAISPEYGYLFYNVGGKLYEYDMGLKQSFLMVDKESSGISLLKFQHFMSNAYVAGTGGKPILSNKLVVASADPSKPAGSNGTLDIYGIGQVNGPLTPFQTLTGFGKVVSLTYRER